MKEPILVTRPSLPPKEELLAYIDRIYDSRWLTNFGPLHREFSEALSAYLGTESVSLFVNGHQALTACLKAMGLSGEILTTPFTFASTTHAILEAGCTPVFCDIDPVTYTLDPERIEEQITERTSAILPVHVYGIFCDIERIGAIAEKHHLRVVYDAAHTFGETLNGLSPAAFGDASMFSFHATKVFHSIEGGAVASADPALLERLERIKDFGIENAESVTEIGTNAKMNEFQAAMGLCNLRHLSDTIAARCAAVRCYRDLLGGTEGLTLPPVQEGVACNGAYFPVLFDPERFGKDRDEIMELLAREQIHARKYFYPLTSEFACFAGRFHPEETPVARRVSRQVLTLPLYADLPHSEIARICGIILSAAGKK